MFVRVFAEYGQGLIVAGCAMTSISTMGWMVNDIHQREKRTIQQNYESKIKMMEEHIKTLKSQNARQLKSDVIMT